MCLFTPPCVSIVWWGNDRFCHNPNVSQVTHRSASHWNLPQHVLAPAPKPCSLQIVCVIDAGRANSCMSHCTADRQTILYLMLIRQEVVVKFKSRYVVQSWRNICVHTSIDALKETTKAPSNYDQLSHIVSHFGCESHLAQHSYDFHIQCCFKRLPAFNLWR